MKTQFYLFDDATIKWKHDGKRYLLHVKQDECAESPRSWDNLATMACWHRNYDLGDKLDDKAPEDFWRRMVLEYVSEDEILSAAFEGKLHGIRIAENEDEPGTYDIYEVCYLAGFQTSKEAQEYLEYSEVPRGYLSDYLMDDLTVRHCMTLLEPYAEWLPLWLYDHSGITMSCGPRVGQYADRWDSGQVGWVFISKETLMKECGIEYVLDENGERIKVEHRHENGGVTYSYQTRPLTDETWRRRAIEIMEGEVETYDQYLTGDVYGFTLCEADPPEGENDPGWNEIDSCWGFYGNDIIENGIAGECPGLEEAIAKGEYETGKAVLHTSSFYTY